MAFSLKFITFIKKTNSYTGAGMGTLEQPLHVVALPCSVSGVLKQLEYIIGK
ncbi:MAG: hypothetical protein LBJ00_12165 [Planctomycetaceae bacterium]|jgi:hypothetical protein|nr:hypothetical protein [Planctomycetaceae bacterium]